MVSKIDHITHMQRKPFAVASLSIRHDANQLKSPLNNLASWANKILLEKPDAFPKKVLTPGSLASHILSFKLRPHLEQILKKQQLGY